MEWTWNGQESVAIPGNFDDQVIKIEAVQKKIEEIHSSMSQRRGNSLSLIVMAIIIS